MICPTCRSEIEDGAKFCVRCGARLEAAGGAGHAPGIGAHAQGPPPPAGPDRVSGGLPQYGQSQVPGAAPDYGQHPVAPSPGAPHGFETSQIPTGTPGAIGQQPYPAPAGAHEFALHPLGLGELFDRTLKLYLAHFRLIFVATAIIGVPLAIVVTLFQGVARSPEDFLKSGGAIAGFMTMTIIFALLAMLGASLQRGATAKIISDIYLNRDTSVGAAYSAALKKFWVLIIAAFLYGLATVFGFMLCLAPGIFLSVAMSLYVFAIMFEDMGIIESLTRSMDLIKGHWWKLALVLFLVTIINALIGSIPNMLSGVIAPMAGPGAAKVLVPLATFFSSLVQMAITPIATVVSILFYYDLRIRKEGYDLEIMAREIG